MKQSFTLFAILLLTLSVKAQEDSLRAVDAIPYKGTTGHASPNGSCDSLNIYAANNWGAYVYKYGGEEGGGSVFGTSNLTLSTHSKILQDANYFDASAGAYNYISGGLVYFALQIVMLPQIFLNIFISNCMMMPVACLVKCWILRN